MAIDISTEPLGDPLVAADEEAVMAHYLTGKPIDPEVVERVHARAQAIREETLHVEDVPRDEMGKRAAVAMKKMCNK